jgi:hypothetical protein
MTRWICRKRAGTIQVIARVGEIILGWGDGTGPRKRHRKGALPMEKHSELYDYLQLEHVLITPKDALTYLYS